MMLRQNLSKDYAKFLPLAVTALNNTPMKTLGFLTPAQISSPLIEPYSRQVKYRPPDVDYIEQERNQQLYEQNPQSIRIGEYVMLNFAKDGFSKSYDTQVCAYKKHFYSVQRSFSIQKHFSFFHEHVFPKKTLFFFLCFKTARGEISSPAW